MKLYVDNASLQDLTISEHPICKEGEGPEILFFFSGGECPITFLLLLYHFILNIYFKTRTTYSEFPIGSGN